MKDMNYDYYIPNEFVDSFVSNIKEVLTKDIQKMIDSKQYYVAFNLCDYVLYKINRIDFEDDTDIPMLSQMCLDKWDMIISIADKDTNDKIFKRFIDELNNDFVDEIWISFFMDHFKDRNYLKHKLKFTQQKALSMCYDDSKKTQWLYYHPQIMQELGYSDDKLMKY